MIATDKTVSTMTAVALFTQLTKFGFSMLLAAYLFTFRIGDNPFSVDDCATLLDECGALR
jgi:hypothetical protein